MLKSPVSKDYIVHMHQYAVDNLEDGCTMPEMLEYLNSLGIKADEQPLFNSVVQIFGQIFVDSYRATTGYTQGDSRYWMQAEAYYRHLDYLEMVEAHKNSKQASILAITAIAVSAVLALTQIIVALDSARPNK